MKEETIKCKCCDKEIQGGTCQLAAYTTVINGKTIAFCCQTCANEYKTDKAKSK